jgi:prepilin-type N-terminal cleavage/methylation domain-containing protein
MRRAEPNPPRVSETPSSPSRPARAGFTLLEVLAAALILALWFGALATSSFSALRAEGENFRLLEAGMLADLHLARALASTMEGTIPKDEETQSAEGAYEIVTRFGGFGQVNTKLGELAQRDDIEPALPGGDSIPGMKQLLGAEMPGILRHVRSIKVIVIWQEGQRKRRAERVTFVFDAEAAAEIYESDEAPPEEAPQGEGQNTPGAEDT